MVKVCLIGAAGGIGQPLSLLLKLNDNVTELALYDVVNTPGVSADLSHIDTNTIAKAFLGPDELSEALKDSDFIIIPAGVPRKPGMTRGDLFNINANICSQLAESIAINAPNAITMVISNPINSTTVIFKDVFLKHGVYNPKRLLGVTNLDHVRANAFLAHETGLKPKDLNVYVVGGHSGHSIVPLLSSYNLTDAQIDKLVNRIQYGGDEVVEAKKGAGSSTLSMAYAAHKFFNTALDGYLGNREFPMSAYIPLDPSIEGTENLKKGLAKILNNGEQVPEFFSAPVVFDKEGVKSVKTDWLNDLSTMEIESINCAVTFINENIIKGKALNGV